MEKSKLNLLQSLISELIKENEKLTEEIKNLKDKKNESNYVFLNEDTVPDFAGEDVFFEDI